MQIKSSADLRNSYKEISDLAKASGEPIYITINGAGGWCLYVHGSV